MQQKIKYFDSANKKIKILPSQVIEIRFDNGSETIRMLSVQNNLMLGSLFATPDPNILLRLRIDGYLKLLTYYDTKSSGAGPYGGGYTYTQEYNILQKGNQGLMKPTWISFRKDMMDYLSDCSAILSKLDKKEFKSREMEEIVQYYNDQCSK